MGALKFIWVTIVILLSSQIISAEIIIHEDIKDPHNVGDFVSIDFSIDNPSSASDFVESYLKCDGKKNLIDKRYIFLKNNNDISLRFPLENTGDCHFLIEFLDDKITSNEFTVSDKLIIDYHLNNLFFFPGEKIMLSGNISKINGDTYSGRANFQIEDLVTKSFEVSNGEFNFEYIIEKMLPPQKHIISITAFEKNTNNKITNSGEITKEINIKSQPSSIEITAPDSIKPPKNISFQINLLNQVAQLIPNETLIIKILDIDNNVLFENSSISSNNLTYQFSGSSKRGSCSLNAYYGSLFATKPIYIEDYRKIDVIIQDNALNITNIGNMPFDGTFEFVLENETSSRTICLELNLDIAESLLHYLKFSGTYNISSEENIFSNIPLTGAAITVDKNIKSQSVVAAIILLLCSIIYILFKYRKKSSTSQTKNQKPKEHFFIIIKSDQGISKLQNFISQQGFKMNKLTNSLGIILYSKGEFPARTCLNLIKKIRREHPEPITILFNKYSSQNTIDRIKTFISANKRIIENTSEGILISDNIFKKLQPKGNYKIKLQNVSGFKIKFYISDNATFL